MNINILCQENIFSFLRLTFKYKKIGFSGVLAYALEICKGMHEFCSKALIFISQAKMQ